VRKSEGVEMRDSSKEIPPREKKREKKRRERPIEEDTQSNPVQRGGVQNETCVEKRKERKIPKRSGIEMKKTEIETQNRRGRENKKKKTSQP
jgi:hypothetical protein